MPSLSLTEVIDEAVDPTCTETGLTEGKHCEASGDLLAEIKEAGYAEIHFVVGNATVCIPVIVFESEEMKAVTAAENSDDFVITLSIADAEIENAVSPKYGVVVALDKEEADVDVTGIAQGVKLLLTGEGAKSCVNEEGVAYTVLMDEEVWIIDVIETAFYTMINN